MTESIYSAFFSPLVRASSNPFLAETAKWLHPMRMSRYVFSASFSPWLYGLPSLAKAIRDDRSPLSDDNPYLKSERTLFDLVTTLIQTARSNRDASLERMFQVLYGIPTSRDTGSSP